MSDSLSAPQVYQPNRPHRTWLDGQIKTKDHPNAIWVGNKHDIVYTMEPYTVRYVSEVNTHTNVATLKDVTAPNESNSDIPENTLIDISVGALRDEPYLMVNTRMLPVSARPNASLCLKGTDVSYVKCFEAGEWHNNDAIISAQYDNSNQLKSDRWEVESLTNNGQLIEGLKSVRTGNLKKALATGDRVAIVAYNAENIEIGITYLSVVNTSFMSTPNAPKRIVTDIRLRSPFLSKTNPRVIKMPLGLPVESLGIMVEVVYTDGTTVMSTANQNIHIDGLYSLLATEPGIHHPVLISYKLNANEEAEGATSISGGKFSRKFEFVTEASDGSYDVKIYVVPTWNPATTSWKLNYRLMNLDRSLDQDVTDFVKIGEATGVGYDPLLQGTTQTLSLAVDLKEIGYSDKPYRHVQTVKFTNVGGPGSAAPNWNLNYHSNPDKVYGDNDSFTATVTGNDTLLNLKNGALDKTEWINNLYNAVYPIFDFSVEAGAPVPTHFEVNVAGETVEASVDDWDKLLTLSAVVQQGTVAKVTWLNKDGNNALKLAITPVTVVRT